jgi:hypothetical protein
VQDGRPSRTAFGAAVHRATHQIMERGTSFPIRSPSHFRLSPESGGKAELASDKMLKLVDSKFLITDDAFH